MTGDPPGKAALIHPPISGPLLTLHEEVRSCRKCPLWEGRTHAVPGDGPPDAQIMVVGEGPGQHEDAQGLPFVGQAGKLLEQLLALIGLRRADVYITNIVKCRPPQNRDPALEEIAACAPYLERQLALINPMLVLVLGRHALARLLPGHTGISRLHGKLVEKDGRAYMPMYHPAAALYNSLLLRTLEEDFRLVPRHLATIVERRAQVPTAPAAPPPVREEQLTLF